MATELSAYEKERLSNIARNRETLVALGLDSAVTEIRASKAGSRRPVVKGSAINKKEKREVVPPRKPSLRQRNLDPEGKVVPDKPALPEPAAVERHPRKPSVPLDAAKISTGAVSAEEAAAFLARLTDLDATAAAATPRTKASPKKRPARAEAPNALPLDLSGLTVGEDDIAKLVPERIFSLEMHPSASKLLVAAGDTWGRVGLWDVDAGDDTPVATFEPHSRPVAGVRVAPHLPHLLLSCSHDGAVRCLDLGGAGGANGGGASFVEVYTAPEDGDGQRPLLHGFSRDAGEGGCLALCRSDGVVVLLDPRAPSASCASAQLHEKKVFSADFSPARPHLLASASLDRTVSLWDVRALGGKGGGKRPKPLATLEHGLSVTSARFSPDGGRLLTTCNDDLLRVWACAAGASDKDWSLRASAKHNNKTGRYLTPFQAEWLRGSDSTVLCGSLSQPRGIDVFDASDGCELAQRLEPDTLTSVVSLIAQHPTRPVVAASNASGKCYLWR